MKKNLKTLIIMLAFIAMLVSCSATSEYVKLTPQEAQSMMTGNHVILDVRTQEEYDNGHIANAVLLPDDEIKEKVEEIISDKNQTIFVYCQTGIRSERASKQLLDIGYTTVYDIGGIVDWTGGMVWKDDTIFYNYFGGELPPDIITPIDFTITKKINEQLPEFTFIIKGVNEKSYWLNYWKTKYYVGGIHHDINHVTNIIINNDNGYYQEIKLDILIHNFYEKYGFSFNDWNFDGYLDISIPRELYGGDASRSFYWLWDEKEGQFARNSELEEISYDAFLRIKEEDGLIYAGSGRMGNYKDEFYIYESGKYILVKQICTEQAEGTANLYVQRVTTKELIDGKMKVTDVYYEEFPIEDE